LGLPGAIRHINRRNEPRIVTSPNLMSGNEKLKM
jgi:hypothetical protein